MATNTAVPFWDEGNTITCHASAAVTGRKFVSISGARVEGNPRVAHVAQGVNGKTPLGVAGYDAPSGGKVSVYSAPGIVMPVIAAVAITANDLIYSTADGSATNVSPGAGAIPAGKALDDAVIGAECPVKLA